MDGVTRRWFGGHSGSGAHGRCISVLSAPCSRCQSVDIVDGPALNDFDAKRSASPATSASEAHQPKSLPLCLSSNSLTSTLQDLALEYEALVKSS